MPNYLIRELACTIVVSLIAYVQIVDAYWLRAVQSFCYSVQKIITMCYYQLTDSQI